MNIHRARMDDDRATESSSGGTTVPEPERPTTAPTENRLCSEPYRPPACLARGVTTLAIRSSIAAR